MSVIRPVLRSLRGVLERAPSCRTSSSLDASVNSEREKEQNFTKQRSSLACAVFVSLGALAYSIFGREWPVASAAAKELNEEDSSKQSGKRRSGFRDRRIMSYEDRLRAYSTPDKLFRYFATVRMVDSIYMTPEDFVRSITPGVKQPDGLGLDSFQRYSSSTSSISSWIPEDSVFKRFGKSGLISFPDYVFLLTLLASPPRQFEIAFRMFDRNGDGLLERKEFELVRSIIMSTTYVGKRHRDREVTGSTLRTGLGNAPGADPASATAAQGSFNLVLSNYFFGPDGDRKLSVEEFLRFQAEVQTEVCRVEFSRYGPVNGRIHELDFADALLTYADLSANKRKRMIRRVRHVYPRLEEEEEDGKEEAKKRKKGDSEKAKPVRRPVKGNGITFKDYCAFIEFVRNITDVDTALSFYNFAGVPVDRATFRHVARTVAHVDLAPRVLDVMFLLFDENEDDRLSQREFTFVMKRRQMRCLDRPMDTGFVRFVTSLLECAWEQRHFTPLEHGNAD